MVHILMPACFNYYVIRDAIEVFEPHLMDTARERENEHTQRQTWLSNQHAKSSKYTQPQNNYKDGVTRASFCGSLFLGLFNGGSFCVWPKTCVERFFGESSQKQNTTNPLPISQLVSFVDLFFYLNHLQMNFWVVLPLGNAERKKNKRTHR